RNAHWNVTGPHFHALHKLFEAQYESLEDEMDEIAERMRALDVRTPATLTEFLKETRLEESPGKYPPAHGWVRALLADHETIIRQLREDVKTANDQFDDAGTTDFLTSLMEEHEKTAWMLRATLQGES